MIKGTMPAIEVQDSEASEEVAHYECAFHILPTIADEEVSGVVQGLQALITRSGGTLTSEESAERYDLAYEIVKQVDGVNRRFNAAHFGWMRFALPPAALLAYIEEIKQWPEILRYLIIRLTRDESRTPFSVFETRRAEEPLTVENTKNQKKARGEIGGEADGKMSAELLDQSLEKLTTE